MVKLINCTTVLCVSLAGVKSENKLFTDNSLKILMRQKHKSHL